MSENLHKRRSSMRTRGYGVSAVEKQLFKLQALAKGKRVMETSEPPPLKWSAPIVRKRRTINGHQETQARRDCREVTAG